MRKARGIHFSCQYSALFAELHSYMATNAGFEPADGADPSPVFGTGTINQALSIRRKWRFRRELNPRLPVDSRI